MLKIIYLLILLICIHSYILIHAEELNVSERIVYSKERLGGMIDPFVFGEEETINGEEEPNNESRASEIEGISEDAYGEGVPVITEDSRLAFEMLRWTIVCYGIVPTVYMIMSLWKRRNNKHQVVIKTVCCMVVMFGLSKTIMFIANPWVMKPTNSFIQKFMWNLIVPTITSSYMLLIQTLYIALSPTLFWLNTERNKRKRTYCFLIIPCVTMFIFELLNFVLENKTIIVICLIYQIIVMIFVNLVMLKLIHEIRSALKRPSDRLRKISRVSFVSTLLVVLGLSYKLYTTGDPIVMRDGWSWFTFEFLAHTGQAGLIFGIAITNNKKVKTKNTATNRTSAKTQRTSVKIQNRAERQKTSDEQGSQVDTAGRPSVGLGSISLVQDHALKNSKGVFIV